MQVKIYNEDCITALRALPPCSVHTCVTSPPYYGLRDYGDDEQIGLEATPEQYIAKLVAVFREVRRVLRDDGTLWLNIGDSYAGSGKGPSKGLNGAQHHLEHKSGKNIPQGMKAKDLMGVPWMLAFALRADGWYLRQDIIWHKPNPMPESVQDRCTKAHEYVFLLSKQQSYYYNAEAIAEDAIRDSSGNLERVDGVDRGCPEGTGSNVCSNVPWAGDKRNKRSVWQVGVSAFAGAHFATFPPELIAPCILAGSPPEGLVLDPFFGAGTTGLVADGLGRDCIGCEISSEYALMAQGRIAEAQGMFGTVQILKPLD